MLLDFIPPIILMKNKVVKPNIITGIKILGYIINPTIDNNEKDVKKDGAKWMNSSILESIFPKLILATPQLKTCRKNFFNVVLLL